MVAFGHDIDFSKTKLFDIISSVESVEKVKSVCILRWINISIDMLLNT